MSAFVSDILIRMKLNFSHKAWIASIFLLFMLGAGMRFWQLGYRPAGVLVDEAHFGYIALSVLETGRDEHGQTFPITFQGFGDQKLPLQVYLLVPVVKFFGLANDTIRYPSAAAGSILVLAVIWFARSLRLSRSWSLLGGLLVAVSPWTFFLSRIAFESNLALLIFTGAITALVQANRSLNKWWWFMSGSLLGLTWYAYIAYRPITLGLLTIWLFAKWWNNRTQTSKRNLFKLSVIQLMAFFAMVAPLLGPSSRDVNQARFNQIGILNDSGIELKIQENLNFCDLDAPLLWCRILWNKPAMITQTIASRWLASYSPQYLATHGEGNEDYLTVDGFGEFYWLLYPFLLIGLAHVLRNYSISSKALILGGLLISPIPSILVGDPQPVRASAMIPFIIVLIVEGIKQTTQYLQTLTAKGKLFALGMLTMLSIGILWQTAWFYTSFLTVHTVKNELSYQSTLPELHSYLESLPTSTVIYIKDFYTDPVMYYAYYTNFNPSLYQQQVVYRDQEQTGFRHPRSIDRVFEVKEPIETIGCLAILQNQEAVYVTNQESDSPELFRIKSTNGVHTLAIIYDADAAVEPSKCRN